MSDGPYVAALIARKGALTTQLRQIDDAVATADGHREAQPGDLPWRASAPGTEPLLTVEIDGTHYPVADAEELTRAGLHECDLGLEDVGLLPKGDA